MASDDPKLRAFFDTLSDEYTSTIQRCFPRYREMLWALLDYLPRNRHFTSILELGCGTGNLSVLLDGLCPESNMHLVDISGESLDACRSRLAADGRHAFEQQDFRDLQYEPGSYDLVVSSIAIHHLPTRDKRILFDKIHGWLKPSGLFTYADQFGGATDDLNTRHIENWKRESLAAGSNEHEFAMWMTHQRDYDHHDTLKLQLDWLSEIGFVAVDCPWRFLLWSVVQARKA